MITLYDFLESLRLTSEALALRDKRLRTLEKVLHWWDSLGYGAPDPDSPISSCFVDDWMVIDAKDYKDFPKQSIAVVKDGYVLFKNNGNGRVKKAGIYDGGTYNRDTNLKSLEYGVDFDDSDLVLMCKYKIGDKIGYSSKDLNISDDQLIRRLKILKNLVFKPSLKELQIKHTDLTKKFREEVEQSGVNISGSDLKRITTTVNYVVALLAYYDLKDVKGIVNHLRDVKGSNQVMHYNFNKLQSILNRTLKDQLSDPMYRLVSACIEFMSAL
jgi:hypothetical protein